MTRAPHPLTHLSSSISWRGLSLRRALAAGSAIVLSMSWAFSAQADYPIASHRYLADPGSLVHDGRLYLYASNDDDNNGGYDMASFVLVSTTDLKNWTDHGEVLRVPRDASWAQYAWAPAVAERNGKIYLYFGNSGNGVGCASSDSPLGPFKDAKGGYVVNGQTPGVTNAGWFFDPSVFIDDDGQAYLTFGGNGESYARIIKLKEDMVSIDGAATELTVKGFFEASWLHKRGDNYYFSYSSNSANGLRIDYEMSKSPMSGYTYTGTALPQPPSNNNNNHAAIFEYGEDKWYIAYHNRIVANTAGIDSTYKRNLALDVLTYAADGKINTTTPTADGLEQLHLVSPYERLEGEMFNAQKGIETNTSSAGGMALSSIENGDWIRVVGVDFGDGAESLTLSASSQSSGGQVEVHLDSETGTLVATCDVASTGGFDTWQDSTCDVTGAEGEHDVYLVFKGQGNGLFNLDFYQFTPVGGFPVGSGGGSGEGSGGQGGDGTGGAGTMSGGSGSGGDGTTSGAGGIGPSPGAGGAMGAQSGSGGLTSASGGANQGSGGDAVGDPGFDEDTPGCSCRSAARGTGRGTWSSLLGALAVAALWRRRRA